MWKIKKCIFPGPGTDSFCASGAKLSIAIDTMAWIIHDDPRYKFCANDTIQKPFEYLKVSILRKYYLLPFFFQDLSFAYDPEHFSFVCRMKFLYIVYALILDSSKEDIILPRCLYKVMFVSKQICLCVRE